MLTIAVVNQKGGVGKTTTTVNLGYALAWLGFRLLLVDLDPQGSLSQLLGTFSPEDRGLADVLADQPSAKIPEVAITSRITGAHLVPSTFPDALAIVQRQMVAAGLGREQRLAKALAEVAERYDVCLIDCPPNLELLAQNGMAAADKALVVTQSALLSVNGTAQLLDTIETVREHVNPGLEVAGALINQHEATTRAGQQWESELRASTLPVLAPNIPRRAPIRDATEAGVPLAEWPDGGRDLFDLYLSHARHLTQGVRS